MKSQNVFAKCWHSEKWRRSWEVYIFEKLDLLGESEDILSCPLRVREWIMCVMVVVVFLVTVVFRGSKVHHHQNFHSLESLHDVSAESLKEKSKQAKTLSNPNRCFKDKTASGIFYQLPATFIESLFTGMLSINLFGVLFKMHDLLFLPTFVLFCISNPVILIKSVLENNQFSFM